MVLLSEITGLTRGAIVALGVLALVTATRQDTVDWNLLNIMNMVSEACEVLPLEMFPSFESNQEQMQQAQIFEYTQKYPTIERSYLITTAHQMLQIDFSNSSELVLYIPGWKNQPGDESTRAVVSALLRVHPTVFMLHTHPFFHGDYTDAVKSVVPLSRQLGTLLSNLHARGLPLESVHIVGFSLGAHIAGLTGRMLQDRLDVKLGRITALDPARPCFTDTSNRLRKNDAHFVQVIHSSPGLLGLKEPIGHVDVFVNGLSGNHTTCGSAYIEWFGIPIYIIERSKRYVTCTHSQAWHVYVKSVKIALKGRQCDSWEDLAQDRCHGRITALGYLCSPGTRGLFYYRH